MRCLYHQQRNEFIMDIVGVYGRAASGKSSVSKYLVREKGWHAIDQDKLGHEVLEEHTEELLEIFGRDILENEKISRELLGKKIFADCHLREKLMTFSYPYIIKKTNNLLSNNKSNIIEGALFYKMRESFPNSTLWYIKTDLNLCIERLKDRGYTKKHIENVLRSQKDIFLNAHLADHVIDNSGNIAQLYLTIDTLLSV